MKLYGKVIKYEKFPFLARRVPAFGHEANEQSETGSHKQKQHGIGSRARSRQHMGKGPENTSNIKVSQILNKIT